MGARSAALTFLALGALFVGVLSVPVAVMHLRDCHNGYDLGIYAQALQRIGPGSFNPAISVYEMPVFSDHFDPILILFSPLARIFDPAGLAIFLDQAAVLSAAGLLAWFLHRSKVQPALAAVLVGVLLFSAGTVKAVLAPAHPTTWAVLALLGLGIAVFQQRPGWALVAAVAALACKEELVFSVAALALVLLVRQRRLGWGLLALATAWGVLAFVLRPLWFGPTKSYAVEVIDPWTIDFAGTFGARILGRGILKAWAHLFVPLVPLFAWARWKGLKDGAPMLAAALPLFCLRLLGGKWERQYGIGITACAVAALLPLAASGVRPPRWALGLTAVGLLATQGQSIGRNLWLTAAGAHPSCPATPTRLEELEQVRELIRGAPGLPVFAEGNLVPRLVAGADVHTLGGGTPPTDRPYLIVFEQPPAGDPWPAVEGVFPALVDEATKAGRATALFGGVHAQLWRIDAAPR